MIVSEQCESLSNRRQSAITRSPMTHLLVRYVRRS
jgi:hypothetical protein